MAGYKLKDETDLAWLDNRDQVKLDVRKVVRRLENALLDELSRDFTAAIARGELLELRPGEAQIAALLKKQADRLVLEAGDDEVA
jgi:hypothetical protein